MSRTALGVPRWAVVTTFALSIAGLALSAYLTYTHFEPQSLYCSLKGFIDCQKVTTSAQSRLLGVPVAFLGLANYVIMTALNSPWGWRAQAYWIHVVRFVLGIAGMIFVIWLLSAELLIIDNICLYCTAVHVVTFALFVVLMRVSPRQLGWERSVAA